MRDVVKTWPTLEICGVPDTQKEVPLAFLVAGVPDDHSVMAKLAEELKESHRVVIACPPLFDKQKLDSDQSKFSSSSLFSPSITMRQEPLSLLGSFGKCGLC